MLERGRHSAYDHPVYDGHWLWENERGRVEVKRFAHAFATVELVGRADDDCIPTIERALKVLTPIGGVELYWDASRLDSFANDFRAVCTDHIRANRKTIKTLAVLSGSALVAMAVSATNLALGGFVASYRDREKFLADQRIAAERHGVGEKLARAGS